MAQSTRPQGDLIEIEGIRLHYMMDTPDPDQPPIQHEIRISIKMSSDLRKPGVSNRYQDTLDPSSVVSAITQFLSSCRYPQRIMERMATEVARICVQTGRVGWVQVKISTPGPRSTTVNYVVERTAADFDKNSVHLVLTAKDKASGILSRALALLSETALVLETSEAFAVVSKKNSSVAVALKVTSENSTIADFNRNVVAPIDKQLKKEASENVKFHELLFDGELLVKNNVLTKDAALVVPLADIDPELEVGGKCLKSWAAAATGCDDFRSAFATISLK